MKTVVCSAMFWLFSIAGIAQGCLPDDSPQQQEIVMCGVTCPACVYDHKDSVGLFKGKFIWAGIEFWTDSIYFAEAIPFELWQEKKLLLLSDDMWGDEMCSIIRSFSLLREGLRRNYGVYVEWHTQLYIEAIVTKEPSLGPNVYVVSAIHVLEKFTGQTLGIKKDDN